MPAYKLCLLLFPAVLLAGCGGAGGASTPAVAAATHAPAAGPSAGLGINPGDRTATATPTQAVSPTTRAATTGGGTATATPFKGVANSECADLTRLKVSWYYNWTLSPGSCKAPGFVPMISGKNEKTAAAVTSALGQAATAGYRNVLGFNEPNKADQSNMTVAQVVALWPTLTANSTVRVGSPATSADGKAWFTDFMSQVATKNLRVDFVALHWYGWNAGSCDAKAAELERYIAWAETLPGNRPLWITEWGCMNQSNPDPATVQAFYRGALAVFARHPRVQRYAWYPWNTSNELVTSGGSLTALGTELANAPASR